MGKNKQDPFGTNIWLKVWKKSDLITAKVKECIFYYKVSVFLIYVNDSILIGPHDNELKFLMAEMGKHFQIQQERDLCDHLRIELKKNEDGSFTLTQPQLIESILKHLKKDQQNFKGRATPSLKMWVGEEFPQEFH
jgi:hypothetical protein